MNVPTAHQAHEAGITAACRILRPQLPRRADQLREMVESIVRAYMTECPVMTFDDAMVVAGTATTEGLEYWLSELGEDKAPRIAAEIRRRKALPAGEDESHREGWPHEGLG